MRRPAAEKGNAPRMSGGAFRVFVGACFFPFEREVYLI